MATRPNDDDPSQIRVSGLKPTGLNGIDASAAGRRADDPLPGQQRLSPGQGGGHVLADVLQGNLQSGQARGEQVLSYLDGALKDTPSPGEVMRPHVPGPLEDKEPVAKGQR